MPREANSSAQEAAGKRAKSCPVSHAEWTRMYAAYQERPTVVHVQEATGVGRRIATRAVKQGWPASGYPPFTELLRGKAAVPDAPLEPDAGDVDPEAAAALHSYAGGSPAGQSGRPPAPKSSGLAAEAAEDDPISMCSRGALALLDAYLGLAKTAKERIESGLVDLGEEITPKVLMQLTRGMHEAAKVAQVAVEMERTRAVAIGTSHGSEIGKLIDQCTDEELEQLATTQEIPERLLEARRSVLDQMAAEGQTLAEQAALADAHGEPQEAEDPDADLDQAPPTETRTALPGQPGAWQPITDARAPTVNPPARAAEAGGARKP